VIKTADWVIDLGPEGGSGGGQIIATGRPETVATTPGSHTGEFLKPLLAHRVTEAKKPTKRKPRKKAA
jgi:excinuclease ABC subunit A